MVYGPDPLAVVAALLQVVVVGESGEETDETDGLTQQNIVLDISKLIVDATTAPLQADFSSQTGESEEGSVVLGKTKSNTTIVSATPSSPDRSKYSTLGSPGSGAGD